MRNVVRDKCDINIKKWLRPLSLNVHTVPDFIMPYLYVIYVVTIYGSFYFNHDIDVKIWFSSKINVSL